MMRFLVIAVFLSSFSLLSFAQHKVEGSINGHINQNVTLLEYFGDKHRFIDSCRTNQNGWFSFDLKKKTAPGLYSLAIGNRPLFNFIYNNEDISLKYDPRENQLPEIIFSIENMIYYDYITRADKYTGKAGMLMEILRYYPDEDNYYQLTEEHFHSIQLDFRAYTERIQEEYSHTLVAHIIKNDLPLIYPEHFKWENYQAYNQGHFLDDIDFNDTILLNTNVLTGKAIDYLAFYSGSNMSKEIQEYYFIQAVDSILHRAMDNGKVYDFLMQYLIEGFDMYGFDKVISHIAGNYEPANTCINEDRKSELQKRIENLRRMAVGNVAPGIEIQRADGSTFRMTDIDRDLILVFFWASWCPHCEAMVPELKKAYSDPELADFEVLAISIDTSRMEYSNALSGLATNWINYSDFHGWDSKAAIDYSIYATPTMFLLDSKRKILARPVSITDLRNALINFEEP
ncbi:MAG: thioredoxin-like domain-containing protein [Bacteroidota bacterium]